MCNVVCDGARLRAALVVFAVSASLASATDEAGQRWLDANARLPGVVTTASGLQYRVIAAGMFERCSESLPP